MTREQFNKNILPLREKLYRYALSITLDTALAEDVLQDVFIKLWTKRDQLNQVKNREAWCIRIVRNQSLDRIRQRKRQPLELEKVQYAVSAFATVDKIEHEDLLQQIRLVLEKLPEQQREIFRLRELMGYSNAEIEEMLDLNHSQVKVSLFRARQIIREQMNKIMNYGT